MKNNTVKQLNETLILVITVIFEMVPEANVVHIMYCE